MMKIFWVFCWNVISFSTLFPKIILSFSCNSVCVLWWLLLEVPLHDHRCLLEIGTKGIYKLISFSKTTFFSVDFRHGYLRLVLAFSPLLFSWYTTLDFSFRQMNQWIHSWSDFIHPSLCQVVFCVQFEQVNQICLFLSLIISLSSCFLCMFFLFNSAPILEPIYAYNSAYYQTLKQWVKWNFLAETSTLSPQNP